MDIERNGYNLNMDRLYSVTETLKILSISRSNLYGLTKDGKIASVKLGSRTLFKESELSRFIESLNDGRKE
ncbi:MAG: Helix-turn-helix domain protein [Syntrophorhabdus sp. PtaU1.Bin153]|nr:MAG: Helix-turn-helix domain protein [Syntrophorhabdus sp. PtaU1.Bin153]